MADDGSAEIKRLLEEQSDYMTDQAGQFAVALKEVPDLPYGIPRQAGFDALANIRQFFRDLRGTINVVDTSDPAKGDVLDSLDELDRGFGIYESALEVGISRKGNARMRSAKAKLKRASQDLQAAKKRLG